MKLIEIYNRIESKLNEAPAGVDLSKVVSNPNIAHTRQVNVTKSGEDHILDQKFVDYIKSVENGSKKGFRNSTWFPHESPEGGLPTIAYGHKLKNSGEVSKFERGISDREAEKLLKDDLRHAYSVVKNYIKNTYKVDVQLTQDQAQMLTDFAFNLGGLDKFPKFTTAVLKNDWETAKKEYKRFYSKGELKDRNTKFYNMFLSNK